MIMKYFTTILNTQIFGKEESRLPNGKEQFKNNKYFKSFINNHENNLGIVIEELEDQSKVTLKKKFLAFISEANSFRKQNQDMFQTLPEKSKNKFESNKKLKPILQEIDMGIKIPNLMNTTRN